MQVRSKLDPVSFNLLFKVYEKGINSKRAPNRHKVWYFPDSDKIP